MEGGYGRRLASLKTGAPKAVAATASENRFAPRRKSQISALVYFEGAVTSLPCIIRDMSTTGAKLEVCENWENAFAPSIARLDRVKLIIRADRVMYDCKIVRRGETELGLKFVAPPKAITKFSR